MMAATARTIPKTYANLADAGFGAMFLSGIPVPVPVRTSKYSFAVIEISKIEPRGSLVGLDQEAQQHLVSTTFGSPSEARDLVGGPYHAVMPRALRGRFEPLDHFVLGHLSILGPLSPLGSPHAAKRFIGLAIGVRTRSRALRSHLRITSCLRCATEQLARSSA